MKRPTPEQIEAIAFEIRDFLLQHELWIDVHIYYNGKCLSTDDPAKGRYAYNERDTVIILENQDPRKYFEYVGDILSMSFEGPLYDVLNYYNNASYCDKIETELGKIFAKIGCYKELGHAWNLSLYPMDEWDENEDEPQPYDPLVAIADAAEALGWSVEYVENEAYFSKYSPAGEDFGFYVDVEDIVQNVSEYAADFDADEHAAMWVESRGENGVPSSIRDLIDDADAIQEMLDELAEAVAKAALKR